MNTVSKSFFGPVSLDEYIQTKIEQFPNKQEFYNEKKQLMLKNYPNIYTINETVEYHKMNNQKQLIKTKLDIQCRKRDMTTLEYKPYRDYRKNNTETRPVVTVVDMEKSKYTPPVRDRFRK